jgi:alkylation response protein AidB-like acyl-CoA dehydrogenase
VINGEKTWNTGIHKAQYDLIFVRTSGSAGDGDGITAFLVPTDSPGFKVEEFLWTFNMPTDHAHISLTDVRVPHDAIFGGEGRGLQVVQHFFNENRIRQAVSSLGAAQFCIDESIEYAKHRKPFGKGAGDQPGHPVPAGGAADAVRDGPGPDPQDGVADGHLRELVGVGEGVDVQLLGQPVVLRGG